MVTTISHSEIESLHKDRISFACPNINMSHRFVFVIKIGNDFLFTFDEKLIQLCAAITGWSSEFAIRSWDEWREIHDRAYI